MNLYIKGIESKVIKKTINVSGSKSESNRLLILKQLFPEITIANLSDSDDTRHLAQALSTSDTEINIGHAGTAMRFLTAYFAAQTNKTVVLSGSERMHNRPIKILVDALRSLGAEISYVEKEGYPPLKITGQALSVDTVSMQGDVSSQYISALLLIAPSLPNGLKIELLGEVTSVPYIKMTLSLLGQLGIETHFEGQFIQVKGVRQIPSTKVTVESDWSSASYFYSIAAISQLGSEIVLSSYKKNSLQGDSILSKVYEHFGVETIFKNDVIILKKEEDIIQSNPDDERLKLDLRNAPDIAQTIAVTCFMYSIGCDLTGLHTLKIKETDRLEALKVELTKLGATISVTEDSLHLEPSYDIKENISVATYNDHRMAMAFAPIALCTPIQIQDAEVVTKSFRDFWKDMAKMGFQIEKV